MIFVGENLLAEVAQKLYGQIRGNSGKNPLHRQNLPAPTSTMKRQLCRRRPFERTEG